MARLSSAVTHRLPLRSLLGVVALAAVLALAGHLVFGAGGLLNPRHVAPGLAEALQGPKTVPIDEATSAGCFRADAAVTAVRRNGDDVLVRFAGRSRAMSIRYRATEDAAIRWAFDHGSESNFWDNTNWFHTPSGPTRAESHALVACLRVPKSS